MKNTVFFGVIFLLILGCATGPSDRKSSGEIGTVVFYPSPPQRPRLQFLHTIAGEEDIGQSRSAFDEFLVGKPQSEIRVGKSYDVASSNGKVYVLDRSIEKLLIIDLADRKFNYLDDQRLGKLGDPSGIWVTADETKYIADMQRKQIVVFGRDNRFLRTYGDPELFDKPVDVAVYGDRIYVSDMEKHQIFVLDKTSGNVKMTIGKLGKQDGELYKPTHVIVDQNGDIFVNDAFNYRIQKFDAGGRFIKSYGFPGDNLGGFVRPKGLDIDKDGHLYVADAAFENVQIFDEKSGQLLLFFGGPGLGPGNMYMPAGVHIDYANATYFSEFVDKDFRLQYILYVGNMFGPRKLNVYGFGEWIGQ